MTLIKRYSIVKDINLEDFIKIKQMAMEDLFVNLAKHEIEMDRPYSIVFKDNLYQTYDPFCVEEFPQIEMRKMTVTLEPIPQVRLTYMSPEDMHLKPDKSLIEKLKNCWRYLHDRSNGQYVMEKQGE